jgi:deoxyadenosine/deoxycytidine kinase
MKLMIGVVGPCAAGKTTLVSGLQKAGYEVRHIAQEHSYVADMWKRLSNPDLLVYLHVSYSLTIARRNIDWTEAEYLEQIYRLRHARQFADCYIDTDLLSSRQVLDQVLQFIHESEQTGR